MIYKRGNLYWYKFVWKGKLVRESTKQGNDRTSLAKGEVGIREKKPVPTLREFLRRNFLPYAKTKHAAKPLTLRYYTQGSDMLLKCELAGLQLDELNDQHAQQFAAEHARLSPSGINRGLRTLRRGLNLAVEWGKLERPAKIHLVPGEHQRDRVLTEDEVERYLKACPQPWRDCASIIVDEGMRPSEVFALQWPHVLLNGSGGLVRIVDGKSKAARRILPMTPRVYQLLCERHRAGDFPTEGWIFPSTSREGHFNGHTAKDQHTKALKDSGVERFEPYVLRHTALTRIAGACNDSFVVMRIAGHSSITMTQRYCHPQADAVERAFAALRSGPGASQVGTILGTVKELPKEEPENGPRDGAVSAWMRREYLGAGRGS
jgi:integrase